VATPRGETDDGYVLPRASAVFRGRNECTSAWACVEDYLFKESLDDDDAGFCWLGHSDVERI